MFYSFLEKYHNGFRQRGEDLFVGRSTMNGQLLCYILIWVDRQRWLETFWQYGHWTWCHLDNVIKIMQVLQIEYQHVNTYLSLGWQFLMSWGPTKKPKINTSWRGFYWPKDKQGWSELFFFLISRVDLNLIQLKTSWTWINLLDCQLKYKLTTIN